ncbi:MAG TPA: PVC-type heme-binding CxxCH protein [Vicinamibacterales bacterium]|nr:PVC-type heme-binding CxxCH protein [Vicinamibacterales bacterium]
MRDLKTSLALVLVAAMAALGLRCAPVQVSRSDGSAAPAPAKGLLVQQDEAAGTISVYRAGNRSPIVTQNARPDFRPYLHPIMAPDGQGVLTEDSPGHHKHQTGLYWGFTRLNGRDYFHNPTGDHWRRASAAIVVASGDEVRWETVYDLLDADGTGMLTETQRWSMRERDGRFELDLVWRGTAHTDVTIGKYDYGGLFLRMPWRQGMAGEVVNAARQRDQRAEGQRAMWIDVGLRVEGRRDLAHVAIFDYPDNGGYPQAWRVDEQFGVGSARARTGDWAIAKGQTEVIRHRFVIYTGTLNDVELTNDWTEYSGNRSTYSTSALWSIARAQGRQEAFLTAEQAAAQMTTIDGFKVHAWAAEPMLTQPMAFCWDDRGRLWIAENRDYETRAQGFSNAGDSRILILEDTDRDGVADSRKVFLEGIPFPAAIAVGFDGLFLGAPPNLLFVPDRDDDDRADMADIEVRLTGWGILDRHETINSLQWGPDGWLYGLQGFATPSKIRKPQGKGRIYKANERFPADLLSGEGIEMDGGVWRYHPTKDRFEVVAHGFSNPWGVDYDAKGQLFITACVIPHLWHVIPGGIFHRQGGQHFNPYVYDDIKTIADHRHRSAHGGARVYQSDAFPESQRGRIFMANMHEHAVLSDVLERKGSGFTARHGHDFLMANSAQWIGFSLEIGPEGALYVLDWHDGDICGNDVLHKNTGRIYRIAPTTSLARAWEGRYSDLRQMADRQLVALQTSSSDWHARRARVILQNRAAKGLLKSDTHAQLRDLFASSASTDIRLRAMWSLHVSGGWTPETLTQLLQHPEEYVRAWAIQLLCEDRSPPAAAVEKFRLMARNDRSPVVRLYLAAALQRLDSQHRWPIASELMMHAEDAGDHNLPKMTWLGVEPLVAANPEVALDYASSSRIPLLAQFIARRAVDASALDALVAAIGNAPPTRISLLQGMRDGLEGRVDLTASASWAALYPRLRRSDATIARVAQQIADHFGDTASALRHLAAIQRKNAAPDERRRALQVLTAQRRPQLVPALPAALDDPVLRLDAIRAIAAFDDESLGRLLIERYASFSAGERPEVVQTLSSRQRYGQILTEAMAKKQVPTTDVPVHVARQLVRVVGPAFTEVYGPIERSAEERSYARYRGLLNETAMSRANLQNGRGVFQRICAPCHKMFGDGGTVGPDLTGSNRTNLNYLLLNVLEPNAEVSDAYKMVVVRTRDGRTYTGTVTSETDRQITLRVAGRDQVVVSKSEVQSREATAVSMMPPGLFDALGDSEVVDLVAFLRRSTDR